MSRRARRQPPFQRRAALAGWRGLAWATPLAWSLVGGTLVGGTLVGCGPGGPRLYSVSGAVTFRGQPVPAGEVRFAPDHAQGNSGPAVIAPIVDGRYRTPAGKGVVGGAYEVRITGFAKASAAQLEDETAPDWGQPLFAEQVRSVELPTRNTTHDWELP